MIRTSEKAYTKEVDYLYKRSKEMLDREKKWKESNDSVFSNMELEVTIRREVPLAKGCKVTGYISSQNIWQHILQTLLIAGISQRGQSAA